MRIIQVPSPRPPRKSHGWRTRGLFLAAIFLIVLLASANYLRPLPVATATLRLPPLPATVSTTPDWPAYGQASLAAAGYGLLATHGTQAPLATASIAKVITALCILQKYPLAPNQPGPTITIGSADLAIYNQYVAQDGSLLPVVLGEQLSEYQALQALMLPSANNIADSLALWGFGSQAAYSAYANQFLLQNGLVHTQVGSDASGYDPSTTSTAADLAQLGLLAANNPVLMQIAAQKTASLPLVGTVYNYDTVLSQSGINGLKTGNNQADQGAFLFTAVATVGNTPLTLAGAVMGAPNLAQALNSSQALVASAPQSFQQVRLLRAGQPAGTLRTAWGSTSPIIATQALQLVRWKNNPITEQHTLHPSNNLHQSTLGSIELTSGTVQDSSILKIAHPVAGPSFWWRLTRH